MEAQTSPRKGTDVSQQPTSPEPIALGREVVHPLPARPVSLDTARKSRNGDGRDRMRRGTKRKYGDDDANSGGRDEDRRRTKRHALNGGVEILGSWVAPDLDEHAGSKRLQRAKVKEVTEWDTWIAPDLLEEQERAEREGIARNKARERRRGRRARNVPEDFDSWVADSESAHNRNRGDEDSDRRQKRSDHRPESPGRWSSK